MNEAVGAVRVVTLPLSRYKVRVRQPSLITLIATGGFPSELASVVWKMYEQNKDPAELSSDPAGIMQMANLIESYVPYVLVSPKIGAQTEMRADADGVMSGTLAMLDIRDSDKRFLFFYGQGLLDGADFTPTQEVSAPALTTFPEEPPRPDARPSREPVRAETVEPDRSEPEPASST